MVIQFIPLKVKFKLHLWLVDLFTFVVKSYYVHLWSILNLQSFFATFVGDTVAKKNMSGASYQTRDQAKFLDEYLHQRAIAEVRVMKSVKTIFLILVALILCYLLLFYYCLLLHFGVNYCCRRFQKRRWLYNTASTVSFYFLIIMQLKLFQHKQLYLPTPL